jgi:hypothetical protein
MAIGACPTFTPTLSPTPTPTLTPTPTCTPRPACIDATPQCDIREPGGGWCPKPTLSPTPPPSALPIHADNGHIKIESVGNMETVFRHDADACNEDDIPDTPARAYHDASGNVHLWSTNQTANFQSIGTTLDTVHRSCTPMITSANASDFSKYTYHEWLHAAYTPDGQTIYALVHNEWYPEFIYSQCTPGSAAVSITSAYSTNAGTTFSHPQDYVIRPAVPWSSSFPCSGNQHTVYGNWDPTNIVLKDGFYYSFFNSWASPAGTTDTGVCVMRTQDLASASAWKVWTGSDWQSAAQTPRCGPIFTSPGVNLFPSYISYSTYLHTYVMLWSNNYDRVAYSLSQDLLRWSSPITILSLPPPQGILYYGAILDPSDTSRNFEMSGSEPYLYFTLAHEGVNRDLIRQKIRFTNLNISPPPQPTATPKPTPTCTPLPPACFDADACEIASPGGGRCPLNAPTPNTTLTPAPTITATPIPPNTLPIYADDGHIKIEPVGTTETVLNYDADACNEDEIPDAPGPRIPRCEGKGNPDEKSLCGK